MISGSMLITVLLWLVAAGLIFFVLNWFLGYVGLAEPFNKIAKVVIALVVVLMLLNAIFALFGSPIVRW